VRRSTGKQAGLFLVALCARLVAAPAVNSPVEPEAEARLPTSVSEGSAPSDPKNPPPVKPSREARARGFELALVVGLDVLVSASYAYDTRVSLPGVDQLRYSGTQRSPGVALSAGGALMLPGPLRRITVGGGINLGGPDSKNRPVIPAGVPTPFSKQNLYSDIQAKYANRLGWKAALSPFIEHDVGLFHGARVRAGYQHWAQLGSHTGSFAPSDGSALAGYNVRLSLRSHLVRVSVNDYIDLEDDTETSHRSKRRSGIIQQWGVLIGTHQTIMVFAAIGPFWQIAR
jgi:hypothetical protein